MTETCSAVSRSRRNCVKLTEHGATESESPENRTTKLIVLFVCPGEPVAASTTQSTSSSTKATTTKTTTGRSRPQRLVFPYFSLLCADVNCDFVLILILYCTTPYYYALFHWRCMYVWYVLLNSTYLLTYLNSTRKLLWFEISKMLIAV